ncbi:MAG: ABC transporter permease [Bacteroides sp.]|nr:ABC transporter permease [Bacteroides sp.]
MLRIYFKQARNLLKQEKLFSSIYIIGTALSLTMVMVLTIIIYVKVTPIYPETNRDRMLVMRSAVVQEKQGQSAGRLSLHTIKTCFQDLQHAQAVGVAKLFLRKKYYVQLPATGEQYPVWVQAVNEDYWMVFAFRFKDGTPFTGADVNSGIRTAVLSESAARRIFGEVAVTGRYFSLNFDEYRVAGVVKDPSSLLERTYAHIWIPHTLALASTWGKNQSLGDYAVYLLAPSREGREALKREVTDNLRRFASTFPEGYTFMWTGQPDRHWESLFRFSSNSTVDFNRVILKYLLIFLILLIIPAVSFSGMIDSRMERRLAECGLRRAVGASGGVLMRQVICENLFFTLLGGCIGLIFSYILVYIARERIFELGQVGYSAPPVEGAETLVSAEMVFNLPVFFTALFICLLLNLLSAVIPAWRASRRDIVHSLTFK